MPCKNVRYTIGSFMIRKKEINTQSYVSGVCKEELKKTYIKIQYNNINAVSQYQISPKSIK